MVEQLTLYLAVILGGVLACIPMVMFKREKKEKKKFKFSTISAIRLAVGMGAIAFSVSFFMGGNLALTVSEYYKMDAQSLIEHTDKQFAQQKADFLDSKGWAFIAIGIGLVFGGLQFLLDAFGKRRSGQTENDTKK